MPYLKKRNKNIKLDVNFQKKNHLIYKKINLLYIIKDQLMKFLQ